MEQKYLGVGWVGGKVNKNQSQQSELFLFQDSYNLIYLILLQEVGDGSGGGCVEEAN